MAELNRIKMQERMAELRAQQDEARRKHEGMSHQEREDAREAFRRTMGDTLETGLKMKQKMLKKGIVRARAACPYCPGKYVHGALVGSKQHMRFHCDCKRMQMME